MPGWRDDAGAAPGRPRGRARARRRPAEGRVDRLGLPAFKVLGASWAVERALREAPGRAHARRRERRQPRPRGRPRGARGAGWARGSSCPPRSAADRRAAIEAEGAELVVVDGTTRPRWPRAREAAAEPGALEIADVGDSGPARWVIDGYPTLFAEAGRPGGFDALLVPAGVGLARRRRGPLRRARRAGRDRRRAGHRRVPDRLAGRRASRPRSRRPARRWPGWTARRSRPRPGRRCATGSPARSPSTTTRRRRRCASWRRRVRDRRLRGRAAGGAARADRHPHESAALREAAGFARAGAACC